MNKEDWVVAAPVILMVEGFDFTVHNNGQHIVVLAFDREYHLWPSTGKWRSKHFRKGKMLATWGIDSLTLAKRYQGVRGLVKYLKEGE
jgi:hypothetical protein